jgi:hypothetical protein
MISVRRLVSGKCRTRNQSDTNTHCTEKNQTVPPAIDDSKPGPLAFVRAVTVTVPQAVPAAILVRPPRPPLRVGPGHTASGRCAGH